MSEERLVDLAEPDPGTGEEDAARLRTGGVEGIMVG